MQRPKVWHVGSIGHDIANSEVSRPLQGGQDQVGVQHVPLEGHGKALETSNLVGSAYLP